MKRLLAAALLAFTGIAGCTSQAEKQAEAARIAATKQAEVQAAAAAAEAARKAQAKQALLTNPSNFIEASGAEFFDKGIINTYRELTKVSLMNKAEFPVRSVKGSVEWLDGSGNTIATVAFSVPGSIAAGDSKTFSHSDRTLETTTIQTDAKKYRIKVTSLETL
jgi:hypothetical protein